MPTTWFITGTSSGFGRELTERALERGDSVAATLRRPERLDDLAAEHGECLWVRGLDVTDTARMREVVDEAFAELGRVDVVVSNAGYGTLGAAEELTDDQIDRIIATNLTASIQLVRAATPHLREQGGGRILQVSSMGGFITFPGFSLYHATKFGIEGFFDSYAKEVERFGIHTTLVEPGRIRTAFGAATDSAPQHPAYADDPNISHEYMPLEAQTGDPAKVVAAMIDAADAEDPPERLLLGSDAYTWVTNGLREKLAYLEAQKDAAFSADVDGIAPVTS